MPATRWESCFRAKSWRGCASTKVTCCFLPALLLGFRMMPYEAGFVAQMHKAEQGGVPG